MCEKLNPNHTIFVACKTSRSAISNCTKCRRAEMTGSVQPNTTSWEQENSVMVNKQVLEQYKMLQIARGPSVEWTRMYI